MKMNKNQAKQAAETVENYLNEQISKYFQLVRIEKKKKNMDQFENFLKAKQQLEEALEMMKKVSWNIHATGYVEESEEDLDKRLKLKEESFTMEHLNTGIAATVYADDIVEYSRFGFFEGIDALAKLRNGEEVYLYNKYKFSKN